MYAGSPVIAVASGGPLETIKDGQTGYLREGTGAAFAEAVRTLVNDPSLKVTMGKAGHEHVKGKFGLAAFAETLEAAVFEAAQAEKGCGCNTSIWTSCFLIVVMAIISLGLGMFRDKILS